jgi:hypothetical protein
MAHLHSRFPQPRCSSVIFDPRATRVKNPFTQIEYELFFIMFFIIFVCLTGTLLRSAPVRPVPQILI